MHRGLLAATFGEDLKAVSHAGRLLVAHVTPLRG